MSVIHDRDSVSSGGWARLARVCRFVISPVPGKMRIDQLVDPVLLPPPQLTSGLGAAQDMPQLFVATVTSASVVSASTSAGTSAKSAAEMAAANGSARLRVRIAAQYRTDR
jgi:hypothetical protein